MLTRTPALVGILMLLVGLFTTGWLASCKPAPKAEGCSTSFIPDRQGEILEALSLFDGDGHPVEISKLIEGKHALIDIWAIWCAPCIKAIPHLASLHEQFKDAGFVVVGVNIDRKARLTSPSFVEEKGIPYPMLYDNDAEDLVCAWGDFSTIPLLILIDDKGEVIKVWSGTSDISEVDAEIEKIFGEAVVDQQQEMM